MIDFDDDKESLVFSKQSGKMIVANAPDEFDESTPDSNADAAGMPLPQAAPATGLSRSQGENNDN